jgi:hypothetical protein
MDSTREVNGGAVARLVRIWPSLDQFSGRLVTNIQSLIDSLGLVVCIAFLISMITPLWIKDTQKPLLTRYLVGGFVLYYLLAMSLLTGLVPRYVLVLMPFILLHISIETYRLMHSVRHKVGGVHVTLGIYAIAMAGIVFSQPLNFSDLKLYPKTPLAHVEESKFRQFVKPGDAIISLVPIHAFVAGGSWRIMPNDSLEKIAVFASRQNVRWLLVAQEVGSEISANKNVQQWYLDPDLKQNYQHLMELKAVSSNGKSMLFRFHR